MMCVCVCVCFEGVEERPIYSSRGRFPTNAHMEGNQVPWQPLLLEVHLDRNQARFGRPRGSVDLGGRPTHLAASRPDLLLDGIFFDPYPYPLVHLVWRPRIL